MNPTTKVQNTRRVDMPRRDAQLALLLAHRWRQEIERAIDHVKKSVSRTELDRWFRKQWYRCQAVRLKREHELAKEEANRRQIGEHGGDENGKEKRGSGRSLGAAHHSAWGDPILRGPEITAVQERRESPRLRGFRQR